MLGGSSSSAASYLPRVGMEDLGPGEIRSGWDQGEESEQGANLGGGGVG